MKCSFYTCIELYNIKVMLNHYSPKTASGVFVSGPMPAKQPVRGASSSAFFSPPCLC